MKKELFWSHGIQLPIIYSPLPVLTIWFSSGKSILPKVKIKNRITGQKITFSFLVISEISCHTDIPLSLSWNWDGSAFATTCKDKSLRVIDARSGKVKAEKKKAHEGNKSAKCIFLKGGKVFTLGFSKRCDRQYALWDPVSFKGRVISSSGVETIIIPKTNHIT